MQEQYIADFNGDTQLFVIVGTFLSYFKSLEKVFYYITFVLVLRLNALNMKQTLTS